MSYKRNWILAEVWDITLTLMFGDFCIVKFWFVDELVREFWDFRMHSVLCAEVDEVLWVFLWEFIKDGLFEDSVSVTVSNDGRGQLFLIPDKDYPADAKCEKAIGIRPWRLCGLIKDTNLRSKVGIPLKLDRVNSGSNDNTCLLHEMMHGLLVEGVKVRFDLISLLHCVDIVCDVVLTVFRRGVEAHYAVIQVVVHTVPQVNLG